MKEKINNQWLDTKLKEDIFIIYFFAAIGTLFAHLTANDNIGFFIALIGVLYGLVRSIRSNKTAIFIMFTLAFDYFGIVPWMLVGSGTLHWYDINILFSVLLFVKCIRMKKGSRFGIVFVFYYIFMFIACYQSKHIYGQGFLSTVGTARTTLVFMGFWPLLGLIRNGIVKKEDFLHLFDLVCKIAVICYIVQAIGVNAGIPITYLPTKVRWGTRIYINFFFVIVFYIYNLYYLLYEKKKKNTVWLLLCLLSVVGIAQSRSSAAYIMVISAIAVLISLRPKKILIYGTLGVTMVTGLLSVPSSREVIVTAVLESSGEKEGSISYRFMEQRYFNNLLEGHEAWGIGIPNNHADKSVTYSGKTIHWETQKFGEYYLSDLGAYKIKYQFGIYAYVLYFAYLIYVCLLTVKYRAKNVMAFTALFSSLYLIINSSLLEILTREPFVFMLLVVFAEFGRTEGLRRKSIAVNPSGTQKKVFGKAEECAAL